MFLTLFGLQKTHHSDTCIKVKRPKKKYEVEEQWEIEMFQKYIGIKYYKYLFLF